jgi:hypothetical protein
MMTIFDSTDFRCSALADVTVNSRDFDLDKLSGEAQKRAANTQSVDQEPQGLSA